MLMGPNSAIVGSRSILQIKSFKSRGEICGYTKRLRSFMRHTCLARRLAAAVGSEFLCTMALMDQPDIRSLIGQVPAGSRAPMPRTFLKIHDGPQGAIASAEASRCAERCSDGEGARWSRSDEPRVGQADVLGSVSRRDHRASPTGEDAGVGRSYTPGGDAERGCPAVRVRARAPCPTALDWQLSASCVQTRQRCHPLRLGKDPVVAPDLPMCLAASSLRFDGGSPAIGYTEPAAADEVQSLKP